MQQLVKLTLFELAILILILFRPLLAKWSNFAGTVHNFKSGWA